MCWFFYYNEEIIIWQRSLAPLLYDPSNEVITVSSIYKSNVSSIIIEKQEEYIGNDEYINYSPKFYIDDTELITIKNETYCSPSNFGYSVAVGEVVFPIYNYPRCDTLVSEPIPTMKLDYDSNEFTMSCKDGSPYYVLEPEEHKGKLFQYNEIIKILSKVKYTGPVKLKNQEFAFGSCDGTTFNNAIYLPRYNATLFDETSRKIEELKIKNKNLIVLVLTIDSYSRRHFFRKLPQTVEFLNNLNSSFAGFDFKLHNEFGESSIQNMVPVFSDTEVTQSEKPREYDVLKKDSMWSYFRSKGYVTLFGLEDCNHYFPDSIGRYPDVDYTIRSFFCAAKYLTGLNTEIDSKPTPRCVGSHMSHYYALNYVYNYSKLFSGLNQWIYLHLNTAHEASGQHAGTLDIDLKEFLEKYLSELGQEHEIAIFLQADHGMRYGNWYKDIEAYQENKLPSFFLISSRSLLNRIPFSYDNLIANSFRLTTKKDLRPTINFLASMPYYTPDITDIGKYVNLFTQRSPLNRSCEEISISPFDCSCLVVEEIIGIQNNKEVYSLALEIIQEGLNRINTGAYTPYIGDYGICRKLSFHKLISSYGNVINNKVEELQLKFTVNESKKVIFEVFAFVGTHIRSTVLRVDRDRGTIVTSAYRGNPVRIKIFGIKRIDPYEGPCENLSRKYNIKSEYCVCKPLI